MRLGLLAAAWLAGTYIGLRTDSSTLALLLLFLATLGGGPLLRLYRLSLWPMVLASVLLLALLRVETTDQPLPRLPSKDGQVVTLRGKISDDPEATSRWIKFTLAVEAVDQGNGLEPIEATVLAYAEPPDSLISIREPPFFHYNDNLLIEDRLQQPKELKDFDYPSYLTNQGISGIVFARVTTVLNPEGGTKGGWQGRIFDLRRQLSENIDDALSVPQSAVAKALLLGRRGQLPDQLVQDFRETGTSHLLAISGLHVGALMAIAMAVAVGAMGRRWAIYLLLPLLLIWLYALVSGLPPSVLRATVMGTVYLAALALGRPRSVLPALALSAAAMVAFDPKVLQQVSFQLSFAAMAGIALASPYLTLFSPAIARGSATLPTWMTPWAGPLLSWTATALIVSIAATLATWPLVALNFERIPVFGIPVTILALPALPLILIGGLATAVIGFLHPALGHFFGWITWVPLSYLVELVAWAPGHTISGAWVGTSLVWAWYIGMGTLLLLAGSGLRLSRWFPGLSLRAAGPESLSPVSVRPTGLGLGLVVLTPVLLVAGVLLWMQLLSGPDGKLHVYFFDVGQGDSTLIVTPKGRQILVDGGPDAESATRALAATLPTGDRSLDMVVLTHLDADHSRGLLRVLDHYGVASVLVGLTHTESTLYPQWTAQMEREGPIPIQVRAGHRIVLEPALSLEVLNPTEIPIGGSVADQNNNGVVLRLVYGEVSFLLAADIEAEAERDLNRRSLVLESEVLKVPHHGSKSSTTSAFLARVDPVAVVVSVGQANRFEHPHSEVVDRLNEAVGPDLVYRTDQQGTIEFISDGETLWARTER